ncbi:MAG: Crp/Fnr family transcriptional regulator [Aridibacter famidurans]|nr:Crp/Fnr family transcriptional regulator [Aridibacter famidurans]
MNTFLETISPELSTALLSRCREKRYAEGHVIFSEGEEPAFLPFVREGRVKLVRHPGDGKEVIMGMFSSGEVFAIPPAMDGKLFPATAIAMEPTDLLLLYIDDMRALLKDSEEFSSLVLQAMCGILRDRADTAMIHNTPSAEARVAEVLLKLASESRQEPPVKIALRRQDIAEIAGITTETAIRSIRKLHAKGLFRIDRGKIFIDSTDPLRDYLS